MWYNYVLSKTQSHNGVTLRQNKIKEINYDY